MRSSRYTGNQRWRVELELWKVYDDCKVDDWDGYGAIGVSKEGYEVAREFLEQLPNFIANPEVSADPDGEISFEWFKSNDVIFAVSISSSLKLSFAGTFHSESVLGIENFGLEIPQAILKPLSKHFSGSSTTSI